MKDINFIKNIQARFSIYWKILRKCIAHTESAISKSDYFRKTWLYNKSDILNINRWPYLKSMNTENEIIVNKRISKWPFVWKLNKLMRCSKIPIYNSLYWLQQVEVAFILSIKYVAIYATMFSYPCIMHVLNKRHWTKNRCVGIRIRSNDNTYNLFQWEFVTKIEIKRSCSEAPKGYQGNENLLVSWTWVFCNAVAQMVD